MPVRIIMTPGYTVCNFLFINKERAHVSFTQKYALGLHINMLYVKPRHDAVYRTYIHSEIC